MRSVSVLRTLVLGSAATLLLSGSASAQTRVPRGSSSGTGTIRYAEPRDSRNSRDSRSSRDARDSRDDRERRYVGEGRVTSDDRNHRRVSRPRTGTVIDRTPDRVSRHVVGGREYVVHDDVYYARRGPQRHPRYVVARPPIGARVRYLPSGADLVVIGGQRLYYFDDVYYTETMYEGGIGFSIVEPPVGAMIYSLPGDYRAVIVGGERLYMVRGVYFRPRYVGGRLIYVRVADLPRPVRYMAGVVKYPVVPDFDDDFSLRIRLVDRSRPDVIVAEQYVEDPYDQSVPFELPYDPALIAPGGQFEVLAEVVVGDRVQYVDRRPFVAYPEQHRSGFELNLRINR